MNLVAFSIRTKGAHNFARRLWTVFARFGFSERPNRRALLALLQALQPYQTGPTLFIPAVVLNRHPKLISEIAQNGAEIGIHGHVHNDYRTLNSEQQFTQTQKAIEIFTKTKIDYAGFRNPYLGWTEDSLEVFRKLGFGYESNEAVLHDVVNLDEFSPLLQSGFAKSLALFQAIPRTTYTLRPHFEGTLLRIPTSIPDDEMLFDRLRITDPLEVGRIWSSVMEHVYKREGIYTLNLHPERGILCKPALERLLQTASSQTLPVWITRLHEVANWWNERRKFRLHLTTLEPGRWHVKADCTPRATILGQHIEVEEQPLSPWSNQTKKIEAQDFVIRATSCPVLALSPRTPVEVEDFLYEQGYPVVSGVEENSQTTYASYLDLPEGLGKSREEQISLRSELVQKIEALNTPLLRFGHWPSGRHAALAISGDIDSVTIQDFFLRIIEVH
ncbi:MAG TPA: polysaccharide deacetylase family protein [Ktedonobacteraceae bacterium]|nr:polysaccharide deacetylase family protein [Ktedonobacteraceae bacterium]